MRVESRGYEGPQTLIIRGGIPAIPRVGYPGFLFFFNNDFFQDGLGGDNVDIVRFSVEIGVGDGIVNLIYFEVLIKRFAEHLQIEVSGEMLFGNIKNFVSADWFCRI